MITLAAEASSLDLSVFAQYGVVGAVAIIAILVARTLYIKAQAQSTETLKREQERADKLEAKYDNLTQQVQGKITDNLVAATSALTSTTAMLKQIQYRWDVEKEAHGGK